MKKCHVALVGLFVSAMILASCGGSHSGILPNSGASQALSAASDLSGGLPELGQLPMPQRDLSTVGPGFFNVPLDEMVAQDGTMASPGSLTVGTGGLGYAIYGVFGFDGDNGPTSARITTSAVSGEYYVGFSDYVANEWRFAGPFTDSAEAGIPNTDEYTSTTAFTSPHGTCYFAVLCSAGDSATLTGVELGVQGGVNGPQPPIDFTAGGSALNFYLQWINPSSYHDPDIAGYLLQRAPQLEGDYADLVPELIKNTYFNDSTAAQDVVYRYRVCTVDDSGNRSLWRYLMVGPLSSAKSPPVVQLDLPLGPLYGPVDVTFDLGASFDPEGEGITTYSLNFIDGLAPLSGATPTFNVTMQPGCYTIGAQVECAGPPVRKATNYYRLIVYPRWEESPVVVREPGASTLGDGRQLLHASGTFNTAAQRLTFCGFDVSSMGFRFYSAPASNPADLSVTRLPMYVFPMGEGEAFDVGTSTFYAYATSNTLDLLGFDGTHASHRLFEADPVTGHVAAAYDGSQIWLFYDEFDGIATNLQALPTGLGSDFAVVPDIGGIYAIDAQYNPDTGYIDIVYSSLFSASTEWLRVDTTTETVVDSATLDPGTAAEDIDLELDPGSGRPIVLYSISGSHRFRELDELSNWTPEVEVDNSVQNYTPLDLIVDDGTRYAYFRTGPASQAVLYRDDGATWSAVNTVGFAANSGYEVALVPQPGNDDRALVLDRDFSQMYHFAQLHSDGTDTDLVQLPATDGQGFEMHAAAATDGLHAVWRSFGTSQTRHATSVDGESWVDPGDIGFAYLLNDLATDASGDLYYSCFHFGDSQLYYWDGLAFDLRSSFAGTNTRRPFFSKPNGGDLVWCAYQNGTTTMHYVDVNEPAYSDNPVVITTTPVWDGVGNTSGGSANHWVSLVGGGNANEASISWSEIGDSSTSLLYDQLLAGSIDLYDAPLCTGRFFASTSYLSDTLEATQAVFCTRGKVLNPVRYTIPLFKPPSLDEIPVGKDYSPVGLDDMFNEDVRDTASCAKAYSLTGLVLLASGDGTRSYFAWSHYGHWEELPLPTGVEHMCMPQLVVGLDGRWHIIYKDWVTDQMMCISTL